jgi:glutamyl-Q tRNA(Asp) synthetase
LNQQIVTHKQADGELMKVNSGYIGRFAPSPSGPLHFGSAVAALASFLQARQRGGQWQIRIDDLDPPREQRGATRSILDVLVALGLEWDGPVTYQSERSSAYENALQKLADAGLTFPCACTRKQLGGRPYPGNCRNGVRAGLSARTLRVRVDERIVSFVDALQGGQQQQLADVVGDFILVRADGYYSYHLAVVVDDHDAGITEIVRGVDLIESTPRQVYLQHLLGCTTPEYVHIPIVLNDTGTKLSKQTFAAPIDAKNPAHILFEALRFLSQRPPLELAHADVSDILQWAHEHWDLAAVGSSSSTHRNH